MNEQHELEARILELEAAQLSGRRRIRQLTATNVVLAAVVLAFGGAGAAYALAAANSVNSASIIDGSITHADIKANSIGGTRFLDNSVTGRKILDSTVTGADVNESTLALTCPPAAPTLAAGLCVTGANSATTWLSSFSACVAQNLRLPTPGEAGLVSKVLNDTSYLWTDAVYVDDTVYRGLKANSNGVDPTVNLNVAATVPYRCVTTVGARPPTSAAAAGQQRSAQSSPSTR